PAGWEPLETQPPAFRGERPVLIALGVLPCGYDEPPDQGVFTVFLEPDVHLGLRDADGFISRRFQFRQRPPHRRSLPATHPQWTSQHPAPSSLLRSSVSRRLPVHEPLAPSEEPTVSPVPARCNRP